MARRIPIRYYDDEEYLEQGGVYAIEHDETGQVYIGQSQEFWTRWRTHHRLLREHRHTNHQLQAAWTACDGERLYFLILDLEQDEAARRQLERTWIQHYGDRVYNKP